MKYMLLIYKEPDAATASECERGGAEAIRIANELKAAGRYVSASPLAPVSAATSVRARDGKPLVTDGPFAETREQLGGYFLIDVPNLDEALSVATRLPMSQKGTIEIRPLMELPGLPKG
jgi:hypothetical protein